MAEEDDRRDPGQGDAEERRQSEVPSIIAASMIVFGTPCSAAMKMIMKKPVFFQTSMMMIDIIAGRLEVSQRTGGKAEPDQVVVDDPEVVAVEIAPDDRDEGGGDDHRQEEGEPEEDRAASRASRG